MPAWSGTAAAAALDLYCTHACPATMRRPHCYSPQPPNPLTLLCLVQPWALCSLSLRSEPARAGLRRSPAPASQEEGGGGKDVPPPGSPSSDASPRLEGRQEGGSVIEPADVPGVHATWLAP